MAKPLQKKRENRAAEKTDLTFHPYHITPETAHTAILLLESEEPEVLCHTLRAITKFAAQDMSNRTLLYSMDAIKYILRHIRHSKINIMRFALKALSQLCQLPRGPEQVLVDQQNLRKITYTLERHKDEHIQEFSALALSDLTREPEGCHQLISANILVSLFNRMKHSPDPDIKRNCLQTLSNVLEDPVCAHEITKSPMFNWPVLLALLYNKYLAIQQTALKTVNQLVSRLKDATVQGGFKESTGVLDLCNLLETEDFAEVHAQTLNVLRSYVENEDNAAHVYQSGCVLRLLAYLDIANPAMKPHCIAVLTKMSFTANGRHSLYETGTDLVFCHHLLGSNADLLADAAMGIANMTKMESSATRMADTNIVEALGGIITDEGAAWFNVRINALFAISELCRTIPKAAASIVEPKIFGGIRNINKKAATTPIEAQKLAVQCFMNLLTYPHSTKPMLNSDFMSELLNILRRPDVGLKTLTCKVLIGLMMEDIAKNNFTARDGEEVIHTNLSVEHVGLRTVLCHLIIVSVTPEGAAEYLQLGTLQYMIENKQARYTVSAWEPALEAIFRCHPSAKLAYCGRLGSNDFTTEGFYVMKSMGDCFTSIQELLTTPPMRYKPVLITMFYPSPFDPNVSIEIKNPRQKSRSRGSLTSTSHLRPPVVAEDVNLRAYMNNLRILFTDPVKFSSMSFFEYNDDDDGAGEKDPDDEANIYRDTCSEVLLTLKKRAQILAVFVSEQMSGVTQDRDCSLRNVDEHLTDLVLDLGCRVIGIGWVKCGGALERAVLYKVLADRLGIPCSLRRTSSTQAWCEVSLPGLKSDDYQETHKQYPSGLCRIKYVVDLVSSPGRLIHRGTREAERVCGPSCTPVHVARSSTIGCKCGSTSPCTLNKEKETHFRAEATEA